MGLQIVKGKGTIIGELEGVVCDIEDERVGLHIRAKAGWRPTSNIGIPEAVHSIPVRLPSVAGCVILTWTLVIDRFVCSE